MRRIAVVLICGLLAGGGAGALASKAPPHHAKPKAHRHGKKKPHHRKKPHKRKPARRPASVAPAASTTPTAPANSTTTAPDQSAAPTGTTPTTTSAAPLSHALGVTEGDSPDGRFALTLSRTLLGSGTVTVSVHNASQDPHDLRIDAVGGAPVNIWDELASGTVLEPKALTLAPGTYRVYCTLPGHAALGMDKQITVQAG